MNTRLPQTTCSSTEIGVGTVRTIARGHRGLTSSDGDVVAIDVETLDGDRFCGTLRARTPLDVAAGLRPGVVVAVRFDPRRRDDLALADDFVAARAAFDHMLIRKGLTTARKIELVRRGNRSQGVVTAVHVTGAVVEDHQEITVDLMVSRTDGGQFAARETTFIPTTSVATVTPGSVIDAYYRTTDESAIAITVTKV